MKKHPYKRELLSGAAFVAFIVLTCATGVFYLRQTLSGLETPLAQDLLEGKWGSQFESSFREALPVNTLSRNLWGRVEYAVFHQGRKGVIVGTQNWLFTDEEFSCPAHAAQALADNLAFINSVKNTMVTKNTRLAVVLIPAKARVLPEHLGGNSLPPCRSALYADTREALIKKGIAVTDLLPVMQTFPAREEIYLRTDTHWSPVGARLSAQAAGDMVHAAFNALDLPAEPFSSQAGEIKIHNGDLTSYIPGAALPQDHFTAYATDMAIANAGAAQDLFGDSAPPVTLVGTSYSFNANWNFEGFLKEALGTDVLNMSDEGLGPFAVMDKYLQNDLWKDNPPRLVVWEMPERYLLMPHGVAGGKG